MKKINCLSMCTDKNWKWFAEKIENKKSYKWTFINNNPQNFLERIFKKFNIAKYRAAFQSAQGNVDFVVSHLPDYTAWNAFFLKKKENTFHLAYSFNFTLLPKGLKKKFMKIQFEKIDKFTVYSNFEKTLYSKYFEIPIEKIDFLHLGLGRPKVTINKKQQGDYICAVGGEGRDYKTLIEVASTMPEIKFIIVARPKNLKNLKTPSNVKLLYNIPIDEVFNLIKHSKFAIVPLLHSEVPCGHITMVYTMHLGKAQIVTNSEGVRDYIKDDFNGLFYEAGNKEDLKEKIEKLYENEVKLLFLEKNAFNFANQYCTEERNVKYFEKILKSKN